MDKGHHYTQGGYLQFQAANDPPYWAFFAKMRNSGEGGNRSCWPAGGLALARLASDMSDAAKGLTCRRQSLSYV